MEASAMYDRFTRKSRVGRGTIPRPIREEIYRRDNYTCQFCGATPSRENLTIDHLIPLSLGGLDEMTNYVASCRECNQRKANLPLDHFAKSMAIRIEELPVHGDPVIDNTDLPLQLRLLRKRIIEKVRLGEVRITGRSAQWKLEKSYRREFWQTLEGQALEAEFPRLPGQVRIMIPEIQTVAKNEREYLLLVELAKSARTRNLIGTVLTRGCDVEDRVRSFERKTSDERLRRKLGWALGRFEKEVRRRGL